MSLTAKVYIAFVLALGAAALGHGLSLWNPHDFPRFFCYLLLAIPASCLKVRLPGITGTMSVLFVFLLAGIVELGLPETLVIGAVSVLVQSFWNAERRPRAVQLAFGLANISLAVWASYLAYSAPARAEFLQPPFRLCLAASVFFVANTFPVAAVIALTEGKSLRQVWSSAYFWTFSYYLVGAAIVGLFSFANRMFNWQVSLLILPVVYGIYRSYHLYLDQLQAERTHAAEVASLHERTKTALESAISAKAKLDAVIQASPLAILSVDTDGNVTTWNMTAERVLGWREDETIGCPLPIAEGKARELVRGIVDRTLRGELISGTEMTQWRKDGTPFEAAVWTSPLRQRDSISGVVITIADISEQKRLQEQLRLSQKMEAVGRLAGGIAHDFNNLLTVINGYSSMLVNTLRNNPYAASQANDILASGTRAAELVSQLLTFSRRQMVKLRPIEINQLIHDVERMLRRVIGEHIEIETRLDPDAGWIRADLNQMEAVLLNLATNARDAMPKGGVLRVESARLEVGDEGPPPHPDLGPGLYVCLTVTDTGHGMDAETQQHIFEPFFTTKQTGKGTGLGLSSVYGSVVQTGGHIFVTSMLGEGTTFSIYLPRLARASGLEAVAPARPESMEGSEAILLVEDESAVRRMLRDALAQAGYRVWEAGNGAEALEQRSSELDKIDLLVTDIVMPAMNGIRLAEVLRARHPKLNVIFMSGHSEDMIRSQGDSDLAGDVLLKPFVPEVLVRKVREVLDHSSKRSRPTRLKPGTRRASSG